MSNFLGNLEKVAGRKVVAREIEYDGEVQTLYFRKISGDEADELNLALLDEEAKMDPAKLKGNLSRQIATSLCDENGDPVATGPELNALAAMIGDFPAALRAQFAEAFESINGAKSRGKDLKDESGSGTS